MNTDFSDAALILVGHGSTVNADSKAPTCQHAAALRKGKLFAEVHEAFWKEAPFIKDVVSNVSASRIFVVPLFISEGYFTDEAIPRELGFDEASRGTFPRIRRSGNRTIIYCGPIGTHDSMTAVLLARAKDIVEKFPFPRAPKLKETTLFIAGHGTVRNENSRKAIERQVELIRGMDIYADVHAVFMEEEPFVKDCYSLANTRNIVMVPFFISDGMHSVEDIPVMLGEPKRIVQERLKSGQPTWRNPTEKQGKRLWYSASIGTEPHIVDVVMERVREAVS
jgi:sirohydrochlorin cobaltochelatase